jgi:integrase/recombinase XerC
VTTQQSAPSTADLDAARLLLARLGVSAADLLAAAQERAPAPTSPTTCPWFGRP